MFVRQNYRIYPTSSQQSTLIQWLGQGRFVWNYMLSKNIETYESEKRFIFVYNMNNLLPELKKLPETSFLSEIPSQCLQQKCQDLDTALKQSFKKTQNKKGFPKFKAKKLDESGIRFPSFKFEGNRIVLPKMAGGIKIKLHRPLMGKKGAITVIRDKLGRFFVSILVKFDDVITPVTEITNAIGIDVGLKSFAITSDAEIIDNPKFYRAAEKKILKVQRSHSKKQKGSNNREKSRVKLAKIYKKVANQRKNFCNQVASSIVKNNDLIAIESLNVKGMIKNHKLAKSIADVSWGQFSEALKWQALKRGKHLVEINQWYPSSKTCSNCGYHKADLVLDDRLYVCPDCGFEIDRDLNAAFNILQEGLRQYNTVGTTEIYACGVNEGQVCSSAQEACGSLVHK
mgnify:CR=1 FL=1